MAYRYDVLSAIRLVHDRRRTDRPDNSAVVCFGLHPVLARYPSHGEKHRVNPAIYSPDKHGQAEDIGNRKTTGRSSTDSLVEEWQMATG